MTVFKYFFLALILLFSACSNSVQKKQFSEFEKLENLKQLDINENFITIRVNSTGCTKPNNFVIKSDIKNNICQISIFRIKPDLCKRATHEINLKIKWNQISACDSNKMKVLNPLSNSSSNPPSRKKPELL